MTGPASGEDQTRRIESGTPARGLPEKINEYEVIRCLGEGGMGVVLLARDPTLRREVAIKLIRKELVNHQDFIGRFLREARLSAALNHPNVVTTYQVGKHEGMPYLVLEYVQGQTLRDLLRQPPPLRTSRILEVISQCCLGLEAAARQGIVHRDIKPANIMVREDGLVKVMDFGLSKQLSGDTHTMSTAVMGTPDYMSPEQSAGRPTDFRTDIYALGITIFQCLTGCLPYKSSSVFETIRQHAEEPLPEDKRLQSVAGGRLFDLVVRMTAKTVEDRPKSYAEIRAELEAIHNLVKDVEEEETAPLRSRIDQEALAEAFIPKVVTPSPPPRRTRTRTTAPLKPRPRKAIVVYTILFMLFSSGLVSVGIFVYLDSRSGTRMDQTAAPPEDNPPPDGSADSSLVSNARRRVTEGDLTFSTSRTSPATARDILYSIGSLGANQVLDESLQPERIPLAASFQRRTSGDVMAALCLATGWQLESGNGLTHVRPGSGNALDAVRNSRNALRVADLPVISLNTINQPTNVRMLCDKLSHDVELDYLILSPDVANARIPAVSLSQVPLAGLMDLIDRQAVAIEWTVHESTLIILPRPVRTSP